MHPQGVSGRCLASLVISLRGGGTMDTHLVGRLPSLSGGHHY